jgi:hypothetical protein
MFKSVYQPDRLWVPCAICARLHYVNLDRDAHTLTSLKCIRLKTPVTIAGVQTRFVELEDHCFVVTHGFSQDANVGMITDYITDSVVDKYSGFIEVFTPEGDPVVEHPLLESPSLNTLSSRLRLLYGYNTKRMVLLDIKKAHMRMTSAEKK